MSLNIDLDENNYDYNKLLQLFSLNDNFTKVELKEARKKVLRLHPDKCNLNIKYYMFFLKMYKKLEQIYSYVHHETDILQMNKQIDISDHFKLYLEQKNINPKTNFKEFSREFNKMFENVYINDDDNGYENWLKSDEGIYDKNDIEKSRNQAIQQNQLIQKNSAIEEVGGQSDLFSKLKCFDVKESHSNSVVALDIDEVYEQKPKFNNVDEYQRFLRKDDRNNQPIGLEQSKLLLQRKEEMLNNQAKNMAFKFMNKNEAINKNYESYISKYLKLEN